MTGLIGPVCNLQALIVWPDKDHPQDRLLPVDDARTLKAAHRAVLLKKNDSFTLLSNRENLDRTLSQLNRGAAAGQVLRKAMGLPCVSAASQHKLVGIRSKGLRFIRVQVCINSLNSCSRYSGHAC